MMPEPDPILQSLRGAVRARLQGVAPEAAWPVLHKMNALGMEAPVEAGGMGLGLAAGCAIAEELGRQALPSRFLAASMAIDAAQSMEMAETSLCIAGFEFPGAPLLLDDEAGVVAPVDGALVLLERSDLEVEPAKVPSGAASVATPTGAGRRLGDWDPSSELPEGVVGRARIRQAAYLLGHAHGALTCGVEHATRRKQFGQPLRDFQAIGFRLANAFASLEAISVAVPQAIRLADNGEPFGRQAAEVLAQAAETATELAHVSMQICGVRGMTELAVAKHYVHIRREAVRMGRPTDLWRAVGLSRLTETRRSVSYPSDALLAGS